MRHKLFALGLGCIATLSLHATKLVNENFDTLTINSTTEPAVTPKVLNDGTWASPASKTLNSLTWKFVQVAKTDTGTINSSNEMRLVPINGKSGNATSIPSEFSYATVDLGQSYSNKELSFTCNYIAGNGSQWIQTQVSNIAEPDQGTEDNWTNLESPWQVSNGEGSHGKSFTLTEEFRHIRFRIWANGGGGWDSSDDLVAFDNVVVATPPNDTVSLTLDSSTKDYVSMDSLKGVAGTSARTISAWIKTTTVSGQQMIMSWGTHAGGQANNFMLTGSGLRYEVNSGYTEKTGMGISAGNWHHIVATVAADEVTGNIEFYVDGVFGDGSSHSKAINTTLNRNVAISFDTDDAVGSPNRPFSGELDDIALFDRKLSAAEVAEIYNAGRSFFPFANDSNLMLFYDATTRKGGNKVIAVNGAGDSLEGTLQNQAATSPLMIAMDNTFSVATQDHSTNAINDDTVIEGSTISWGTPVAPSFGILSETDDTGMFTYTFNDTDANNNDSFTYTLLDPASGAKSIGTVTIDTTFTPAFGLEALQEGHTITWTVEDESGVKEYQVVDADGNTLVTLEAGQQQYTFTAASEGTLKVKTISHNGYTQTFYPENGTDKITSYVLTEGWNLITVTGENADLEELIANSSGTFWTWEDGAYKSTITPKVGQGFWIFANSDKELTITATPVEQEISLENGWNLVGPVANSKAPQDSLTIYTWNQTYQQLLSQDDLIEGIGYWIYK